MTRPRQCDRSSLEANINAGLHADHCSDAEISDRQLPEVNHSIPAYLPQHNDDAPWGAKGCEPHAQKEALASHMMCGLRRRNFLIALVAAVAIIAATVGGAVGGTLASKHQPTNNSNNKPANSASAEKALYRNTSLASTEFTDQFGYENYIVIYQLQNRAIYMSAYNSSLEGWVVSPVVDGSNGMSLDNVLLGTRLGLDVYYHNATSQDLNLYWQSPTNAIKTLFRSTTSTNAESKPEDWTSPFSSDRYSATPGSALASYGRQCRYCNLDTYLFFQGGDGGLRGGYLAKNNNTNGWADIDFSGIDAPANNTFLTLINVRAFSGVHSLDLFYRTASGVLAILTYDGGNKYWEQALPRGIAGHVYCLVDGQDGGTEIGEWLWRGDPQGSTDGFTNYDRIGPVNSTVT